MFVMTKVSWDCSSTNSRLPTVLAFCFLSHDKETTDSVKGFDLFSLLLKRFIIVFMVKLEFRIKAFVRACKYAERIG